MSRRWKNTVGGFKSGGVIGSTSSWLLSSQEIKTYPAIKTNKNFDNLFIICKVNFTQFKVKPSLPI